MMSMSELDPMRSTLWITVTCGGQHMCNDALHDRNSQYSTVQRRTLNTGCALLETSKKVTDKTSQSLNLLFLKCLLVRNPAWSRFGKEQVLFIKAKDKVHESERSGAQQCVSDPLSFFWKLLALQIPTETLALWHQSGAAKLQTVLVVFHRRNVILARVETQYYTILTYSHETCVIQHFLSGCRDVSSLLTLVSHPPLVPGRTGSCWIFNRQNKSSAIHGKRMPDMHWYDRVQITA